MRRTGASDWSAILDRNNMAETTQMLSFHELFFNVDNGYLEGLVRGFRSGVLTQSDYLNLSQCETLEGKWCPCLNLALLWSEFLLLVDDYDYLVLFILKKSKYLEFNLVVFIEICLKTSYGYISQMSSHVLHTCPSIPINFTSFMKNRLVRVIFWNQITFVKNNILD